MLEDELLKLRFKAGRVDALERIYEKYRDTLLTLAMQLLNDAGAAEDVVQDVFVSFAQVGETFRLRGSLRSYLATCVVNRVRDLHRARKRRGPVLSLDAGTPLESDYSGPDGRLVSNEQSRLVARALARLPEEQREVIALHLNGQLKMREIARLQDVPVTTARGR
ncbi:MAG: RNA polymerase sigma factor, partial [Planctomycetota bacterium]